jgi:hypothetical protein
MKKIFVLACAVALTMGFGCALTDYDLITDNENGSAPVNTNGKAYVKFSSQIATTYPDGTDNLYWACDQSTSGDRVLTTYNYFTTGGDPFLGDLYCTPDRGGCALVTAQDPQTGDVDPFDYTYNKNCSGLRSLSLLLGSSRYYGECGRVASSDRVLKVLALANQMDSVNIDGRTWLHGNLSALNTSVVVNKGGSAYALPITGQLGMFVDAPRRHVLVDASNPLASTMVKNLVNFNNSHNGSGMTGTITLNGVSAETRFSLTKNAGRVR